jgi:hypothetical protein
MDTQNNNQPQIPFRSRSEGVELCPTCSPYFDPRGAFQTQKKVLFRNIEEIRAHLYCPCCRLFTFLIPNATAKTSIRICSNDFSGISVYDENMRGAMGAVSPIRIRNIDRDINSESTSRPALQLIDHRTWALDFEKLRVHLHQCKTEPRCQMRADRKRYGAAIDVTLVDVKRMCLVQASTRLPFVALSYVCKLTSIIA